MGHWSAGRSGSDIADRDIDAEPIVFADRAAAGVALGAKLKRLHLVRPVIVLGLPRGGVPVAHEVACALDAPLDVLTVRKVGMPGQPELAMGAIAAGDVVVREPWVSSTSAQLTDAFAQRARIEREELERRERAYRAGLAPLALSGQTVILVDDGLATGCTMLAAIRAARVLAAATIIAAAPVASREAVKLIEPEADRVVVLQTPSALFAISEWYAGFEQTGDEEVRRLLDLHPRGAHPLSAG